MFFTLGFYPLNIDVICYEMKLNKGFLKHLFFSSRLLKRYAIMSERILENKIDMQSNVLLNLKREQDDNQITDRFTYM